MRDILGYDSKTHNYEVLEELFDPTSKIKIITEPEIIKYFKDKGYPSKRFPKYYKIKWDDQGPGIYFYINKNDGVACESGFFVI